MHQALPQDVKSLKYITNHDKVCLCTVETNIVYNCVDRNEMLSPDHFYVEPVEKLVNVSDGVSVTIENKHVIKE